MTVSEIMSTEPACCRPDSTLRDVATSMVEHDCGEVPVCDDSGKPIGVVTDRDIVCRLVAKGENPNDHLVKDCMSSPVVTCTPDMDLDDCARLMEQYQVRRVPVVDEAGICCGIVAQADLATKGPRPMTAEVMAKVSQPTGAASAVQAS